jgi:hypothetical protein
MEVQMQSESTDKTLIDDSYEVESKLALLCHRSVEHADDLQDQGGTPVVLSADNPIEATVGMTVFDADGHIESVKHVATYLGTCKREINRLQEAYDNDSDVYEFASKWKEESKRRHIAQILQTVVRTDRDRVYTVKSAINTLLS